MSQPDALFLLRFGGFSESASAIVDHAASHARLLSCARTLVLVSERSLVNVMSDECVRRLAAARRGGVPRVLHCRCDRRARGARASWCGVTGVDVHGKGMKADERSCTELLL